MRGQKVLKPPENLKTILIPQKKLRCLITGDFFRDSEHEKNLQSYAQRLVMEYDYEYTQLNRRFSVQLGSKRFPPDLVAFYTGLPHENSNALLVVEIETEDIKPSDPNHGTGQLFSYMQMLPECRYGIWYNGIFQLSYYKESPTEEPVEINDIPPYGLEIEDIERPNFSQLRPASELRSVFRRCHNYIAGNQGLAKEAAFQELLKLIFCKTIDEKVSVNIQFYVTNQERREKPERCSSRIEVLFNRVKSTHKNIFEKDEVIKLNPSVISYVVSQIQHLAIINTKTDVKGEAYEEIVGGNLRGDRGEFFTPRNVCDASADMIFYTFPEEQWDDLVIIDPACGTGGFLISVINFLQDKFYEMELEKWEDPALALTHTAKRVKDFCERGLHGIDINPTLARATQMNEVMHGNGHGNIFPENSLKMPSEWKDQDKLKFGLGDIDVLFTNPPFGTKIPIMEPSILRNYELGHIWENKNGVWSQTNRLRKSVPPGQLFVERSVMLLKPGGRAAMILADHILTNPGLEFIRQWMLINTKIIARIDLPGETFQPFTGTNAHVILLERKRNEERGLKTIEYESFGAIAKRIGRDRRGQSIYLRTPEGHEILREIEKNIIRIVDGKKIEERVASMEKIIDDDMPFIAESFKKWWDENRW